LPRVYFQLRENEQLPRGKSVASALITEGFSIPEFEIMGSKGTVHTYLRYFQHGPKVEEDRAHILKVLRSLEVNVEEQDFSDSNDPSTKQPRHYELWLGRNF
jgi:hypothetical protein